MILVILEVGKEVHEKLWVSIHPAKWAGQSEESVQERHFVAHKQFDTKINNFPITTVI